MTNIPALISVMESEYPPNRRKIYNSYKYIMLQRKINKNNREKIRRTRIRKKFKQLEKILQLSPCIRAEKIKILNRAIHQIIIMKREIHCLHGIIDKLQT